MGFDEGLSEILSKWTVLSLAVKNEWGGPNSNEKFENLKFELKEFFKKNAIILWMSLKRLLMIRLSLILTFKLKMALLNRWLMFWLRYMMSSKKEIQKL